MDTTKAATPKAAMPKARPDMTRAGNRAAIEFPPITCADLDANEYTIDYMIRGVLVDKQPCILAGPKKSLKTTFIIDLAVALATGGRFLGYFKVERAYRVGVMSGESGMGIIQETARRICRAAGWRLADIGDAILFSDRVPIFGDLRHMDALRTYLLDNAIEVLFIDPAYMAMVVGADAGNLFAQGQLLRSVSEPCLEAGATPVLAHHVKRTRADVWAAPELDDIAWAGFPEWARQWLLIGRREQYEPGTGRHALWLSVGGSAGHSGLWAIDVNEGTGDASTGRQWEVTVSSAADARQAVKDRHRETRQAEQAERLAENATTIRAAMQRYPDGNTKSQIREACGGFRGFPVAFAAMIQSGAVIPCQVVKNNRKTPYDGFKLAET
jgi:replicative DNA helicase